MASGPTIVAKFVADTSQMQKGVDTATTGMGSKIGSFAKTAAITLGGAFAATEIVRFAGDSVKAAGADAEAQEKLARTMRNVAGASDEQVAAGEAFISNLSKQTALSDDELRPAMDSLVRGFGNAEDAQKALALATDISAGTGKDLGSVSEALMKAALGQTTGLKKLGVATKNADGSTKSLDEIMQDLSSTFSGQAAAGADTAAGKMRAASIQFGEFQEQIGTAVLPVLSTLASFFTETLIPALSKVSNWVGDNKQLILAAFIGFGTVVAAVVIPAFVTWAVAAGAAALATLAAAAPFLLIGAAIAAVAFVIIKNWDTIRDVTVRVWEIIRGAVAAAFNWIKSNWPLLLAIITGPIGIAVLLITKNWDTIKAAAKAAFDWVKTNWPLLLAIITGPIGLAVLAISKNWQSIKDGATAVYNWVRDKFKAIADAIGGVVSGISGAVGRVVDAITRPINALIRGWNGLAFTIPTFTLPKVHVPGTNIDFGGGTYGGQRWDFPNLPTLAKGGVLTDPTLFVGGEAGTEIVAPEELLRQIISEEGGGTFTLNIYPRTADAADIAYGFRRLELMAGLG